MDALSAANSGTFGLQLAESCSRHKSVASRLPPYHLSRKASAVKARPGTLGKSLSLSVRAASSDGAASADYEPDLSVTVNGLKMPNPFVIGSGPPGTNYTVMKKAFDEGWGAVICKTVSMKGRRECLVLTDVHGGGHRALLCCHSMDALAAGLAGCRESANSSAPSIAIKAANGGELTPAPLELCLRSCFEP